MMDSDIQKAIEVLKVRISELKEPEIQLKKVKVSGVERDVNVTKLKLFLPLEKAWHFLNKKKLFIGAGVVAIGFFAPLNPAIAEVVKYLGGTIAGIGGAHKVAKAQTKYGISGEFGSGELIAAIQDLVKAVVRIINLIRRK